MENALKLQLTNKVIGQSSRSIYLTFKANFIFNNTISKFQNNLNLPNLFITQSKNDETIFSQFQFWGQNMKKK